MTMMPSEGTFLGSLSADQKKARLKKQKREELLDEMSSGANILKLHNDLHLLADDLDRRVEDKLVANENAYFLAYKSHMTNVQKEFKELRQRADEEETKTRRDAKIQSLEKELDWFMNEALRLDERCKKFKKDLDKWKSKAEALEDDRQFLENQIKTAKRNNKSLRSNVEKAQTSAYSALVSADESGAGANSLYALAVPESAGDPGTPQAGASMAALAEYPHAQKQVMGGLSHELESRYQNCVKRLQSQLDAERKSASKLRAVSDRQFGEPSELEQLFLDCVERVKEGIVDRRKISADEQELMKKGERGLAKSKMEQAVAQKNGAPPPALPKADLKDFTAADRRQVVELLLSQEGVLQFLYDKLFPPAEGSAMRSVGSY